MKKVILFLMAGSFIVMTACNNDKPVESSEKKDDSAAMESKQDRNKKIVKASMESFMKGDLDGTFKDAAAGFVDYADGSIPPISNIDSLKGFMKMLMASVEGYKGENLMFYADGDYVLVHGDWGGTFKNDMMGIKATGKPVTFKDVDIFKLNDEGKIVKHSSVQNLTAVIMAASMTK